MDARMVMVGLFVLSACAGRTPYPSPIPTAASVTRAESEALAGPESREESAQLAMDLTAAYCLEYPEECEDREGTRSDVYPTAPSVEVPAVEDRFIDEQKEELRTVGVTVRWDAQLARLELERGNTLTFRGDLRSDP